jgi:hypothetical protein
MMTRKVSSLALTLNVECPATEAEFNANAKKADAMLEEATYNVLYRSWLPEFREKFLEAVCKETGIERKSTTKELKSKEADGSTKTTEVWDETESVCFGRICATSGRTPESFQPLANDIAATIPFDASAPERKPAAPRKPRKDLLAFVEKAIADGNKAILVDKLSANLGRDLAEDITATDLALALGEDVQRIENEAKAKQMASLGLS